MILVLLRLNLLDDSCRVTCHDGHWRHILCHDRVGPDYTAVAECDAGEDSGIDAEPHLILDLYGLTVGRAPVVRVDIVVDGYQVALGPDEDIVADFYASASEESAALLDEAPFADSHGLAVVDIERRQHGG